MAAASNDHVEVVRVLLEGGADVERVDGYNFTALHTAAHHGNLEVCRLLLDYGANVNTVGGEQKASSLHWAADGGRLSVVMLLVDRGANVRLEDENGRTAADTARVEGRTDVADWLDSHSR
jgi:ankyrin repeat protein